MKLFKRTPQWTIVTSAPKGEAGKQWGDYWFATDLAQALNAEGVNAKVVSRAGANTEKRDADDVVLVLRGFASGSSFEYKCNLDALGYFTPRTR